MQGAEAEGPERNALDPSLRQRPLELERLFELTGGVRRLSHDTEAQNNTLIGLRVPFGIQEFKASWNRSKMHGNVGKINIDGDRTDQFAIGYVYNQVTAAFPTLGESR